ncbi:ABC transporter ATP-binding protein/permease [Candidatus Dependentiae bacterium]|nr:ABC transporter ATP-binding protein/permease [Candidatus Dependentiae bacterium]
MSDLQRILSYTKKYWSRFAISVSTATLYGIFSAAPTYALKHVIDKIFVGGLDYLIIPFIFCFIFLYALKGIFAYLSMYYMNWVGNRVVNDLRIDLFSRIVYFPLSFFKKKTTGELMAHFLNDITMIQNAASVAVKNGVRSFFEAIFLLGVALFQSWQLSMLSLLVAPFIVFSIRQMGRAVKKASGSIQHEMGVISSGLQETFVGIREVKIFNGEGVEKDRLEKNLRRYFSSVLRNVKVLAFAPAFIETIATTGSGFVFYVAARQVLAGVITPGQLTSFFAASLLAYQPIKRLINTYAEVQYGLASASRVFSVMDMTYPALADRTIQIVSFRDSIVFDNMSFGYDSNELVLEDVNLTIKRGERIGLLGPSGSGKSTICDLLLGFLTPVSGHVYIDGHDSMKISLQSLRSLIGNVSQQTFLFNDTIKKNVQYASGDTSEEQVVEACKRAHAHEFIEQCSNKYHTLVGENGTLLSGGQKQRLTIARALLKDPDILIFDEATSALDQQSEEMIRLAIEEISKNKTVIIVSHRVSLIEKMDRVFEIQDRQLVERRIGDGGERCAKNIGGSSYL